MSNLIEDVSENKFDTIIINKNLIPANIICAWINDMGPASFRVSYAIEGVENSFHIPFQSRDTALSFFNEIKKAMEEKE